MDHSYQPPRTLPASHNTSQLAPDAKFITECLHLLPIRSIPLALDIITPLDTPSRMPCRQQSQGNDNRHELQRTKINLMRLQLTLQSLCCLRQPETNSHVDE